MTPLVELVLLTLKGKGKDHTTSDIMEVSMSLVFGSTISFAHLIPSLVSAMVCR